MTVTFTEPGTGTEPMPLDSAEIDAALKAPDPETAVTPEAPKGYTAKGTPRKRAPKTPRKPTGRPSAPRPRPGSTKPTAGTGDARKGAETGLQILAGILAVAGSRAPEPHATAFGLDAVTLVVHGGPLVDGLTDLAAVNEPTRKVLEWLGAAGPYAGLITAAVTIGAQIAVNHDRLQAHAVDTLGAVTYTPDELIMEFGKATAQP